MRAASLPRYRPSPLRADHQLLLYALMLGAALLVLVVLLSGASLPARPSDPEVLAPFRWMTSRALA